MGWPGTLTEAVKRVDERALHVRERRERVLVQLHAMVAQFSSTKFLSHLFLFFLANFPDKPPCYFHARLEISTEK